MADERHHLALVEIDRRPVDGVNATERDRNVAHGDERDACGVHHPLLYTAVQLNRITA
jgi:hypothetical protein